VEDLEIKPGLVIPASELRVSFARSSGPGGQNVNKVESKVELRWTPAETRALDDAVRDYLVQRLSRRLTQSGELLVTSTRTRDQTRNRDDARNKLTRLVRSALAQPKRRKPTRPSRRSVEQRIEEKKRRGSLKRDRRGE
jgi:ribosome-associated protein